MRLTQLIAMIALTAAIVFALVYAARWFSNAATPISLYQPKPGVTCAVVTTADGASISCWKD